MKYTIKTLIILIFFFSTFNCEKKKVKILEVKKYNLTFRIYGELLQEAETTLFTFYKDLPLLISTKKNDKFLDYFSKRFIGEDGETFDQIAESLPLIYKDAKQINQSIQNVEIKIVNEENIIATNNYITSIQFQDKDTIKHTGKERIYWTYEFGQWKILHWESVKEQ